MQLRRFLYINLRAPHKTYIYTYINTHTHHTHIYICAYIFLTLQNVSSYLQPNSQFMNIISGKNKGFPFYRLVIKVG